MDLKDVSNESLMSNAKRLAWEERRVSADVLHHLREIEVRKLHLKFGFASIYEYTVKELGYGEGAAYRRVSAMRLLRSVPEVESKIKSGSLTLDGAAKIQKFINHQKKEHSGLQVKLQSFAAPRYDTKEQKLDLIESLENKSLKEIDRAIVKINPSILKSEKIRQVSDEKIELTLIIDEELKTQLDHLRNLLSHRNPNMTYYDLIRFLTELGIKKFDPSKKPSREVLDQIKNEIQKVAPLLEEERRDASPLRRRYASSGSRHIPSVMKTEVYMRDKGCCTFEEPQTKKRCESRHLLQYDHRYPLSLGGETSVQNLRLLCYQHHKFVTENVREVGL